MERNTERDRKRTSPLPHPPLPAPPPTSIPPSRTNTNHRTKTRPSLADKTRPHPGTDKQGWRESGAGEGTNGKGGGGKGKTQLKRKRDRKGRDTKSRGSKKKLEVEKKQKNRKIEQMRERCGSGEKREKKSCENANESIGTRCRKKENTKEVSGVEEFGERSGHDKTIEHQGCVQKSCFPCFSKVISSRLLCECHAFNRIGRWKKGGRGKRRVFFFCLGHVVNEWEVDGGAPFGRGEAV